MGYLTYTPKLLIRCRLAMRSLAPWLMGGPSEGITWTNYRRFQVRNQNKRMSLTRPKLGSCNYLRAIWPMRVDPGMDRLLHLRAIEVDRDVVDDARVVDS